MRLYKIPVLLAAAAALLAGGCFNRETAVERGNRLQVLHRGIGVEVPDLDPHIVTGANEYSVISALLEGLVAEDPVDLRPVPAVAESWTVSADGLTYTFKLRATARWSNGDPVTADDFVGSYRRILSPEMAANYAYLFYPVIQAEAYHKGRLSDFEQVGFAAPDPRTLVIRLDHQVPYFLSLLTHWAWYPVHLPTIAQHGPVNQRGSAWTRPGRFVGNGPFLLETWKPHQVITTRKNPLYWDAESVRLNGIHFHPIDSLDAEERAFRAGQIHLTEALPLGKIETYRKNHPDLLRIDPYFATYFYRINVTRPVLNEAKVRRALSLAVDRETLAKSLLQGAQFPAYSLTPPGVSGYEPGELVETDFEKARALLAEAGYPQGQGLPVIQILFNSSENHRIIAEALQEMWRRELGLRTELVNQELTVYLAAREQLDYQICRSSWIGDFLDPVSFLEVFASGSGNNQTGWADPAYDQALFEISRTPLGPERNALLRRAEQLLLRDSPIIPIYFYSHIFLKRPAVRGWHSNLLDHHPYKHVYLDPEA